MQESHFKAARSLEAALEMTIQSIFDCEEYLEEIKSPETTTAALKEQMYVIDARYGLKFTFQ